MAFKEDLGLIQRLGLKIVPLNWLVGWLQGDLQLDLQGCVCISFDDGVDADVHDLEFPRFGATEEESWMNLVLYPDICRKIAERHGGSITMMS